MVGKIPVVSQLSEFLRDMHTKISRKRQFKEKKKEIRKTYLLFKSLLIFTGIFIMCVYKFFIHDKIFASVFYKFSDKELW